MRRIVLGLALLAAAAPVAAVSAAPSGPPKPKVTTLGVTRFATVFTSCWSYGSRRECLQNGTIGNPSATLRWRSGAKVVVDLRRAAQDVSISAEHVDGANVVARDSVKLTLHRIGSSGRHWFVRLPPRAARSTDLIVYARLGDRGDLVADLGLRRR